MSTSLPTVVLIHGAWHTPANYAHYAAALRAAGFTVHSPHLPSCAGTRPPTAGMREDAAAVRAVVEPLVAAGTRVLMVMHSYGGLVGTDAVTGLLAADRAAEGKQGGVVHMVYLCGFILPPGSKVWDIVREAKMEHLWAQFVDNAEDGSTFPKDPRLLFFAGVQDEAVVEEGLSQLVPFPMAAFELESTGDAWRKVPVTYVMTQLDYALPRVYQDLMLAKVKDEGVVVKLEDLETAHSCFLTMEEKCVEIVLEAARDVRNER